MQIETMTVEEATQKLRALGVKISTSTLRDGIAQGQFSFGSYIKTEKSCVCYVWTRLFDEWVAERRQEAVMGITLRRSCTYETEKEPRLGGA